VGKDREAARAVRVLIAAAVVVTSSACASATGRPSTAATKALATPTAEPTGTYPVWSDGWTLGQPAMAALEIGSFHAALTPLGACAWLGGAGEPNPTQWPAGWTIVFAPTPRLLDDHGAVVAREGEKIGAGGGGRAMTAAQTDGRCGSVGDTWVFEVEGSVGPAP
jgi:hypothetical protein